MQLPLPRWTIFHALTGIGRPGSIASPNSSAVSRSIGRRLHREDLKKQGPDLNVPAVGQLEGRAFLGLNPFCRIKYYKGQLLEVVLPCMTQLFIPGHKYFLGHMVNTLAVG